MTHAKTPLGRVVTIEPKRSGSGNHGGAIYYGGIALAEWMSSGTGCYTLEDALIQADVRITSNSLTLNT